VHELADLLPGQVGRGRHGDSGLRPGDCGISDPRDCGQRGARSHGTGPAAERS
jgi:hypothetical protein